MQLTSAFGHFDDIEHEENLSGILELLANSGYFRAKIQGLSAFDKIVGGMVWCISLCAGNVDVDLLYSENSTLGQKIALTEKIVRVLPEMKCPFSLEPHQIQGMDSIHIYPVIKWLVEEASFVREKLGDETLNYAVYQFGQQGWKFSDELEKIGNSGVLPLVKRGRKVYKRVMRMRHSPIGKNLDTKNIETSEEESSNEKEIKDEEEDKLIVQGMDDKGEFVYSTGGKMPVEGEEEEAESKTMEELNLELEKLEFEEEQLDDEIANAKLKSKELEKELQILKEKAKHFDEAVQNVPKEMLNQMKNLLAERDDLKAAESAFKSECREELAKLDKQIEENVGDGENGQENAELALSGAEQKIRALYMELTTLNGEIADLGRKVGAKPSQAEIGQYQRRFVELCNQTVSKHRETKRQFTLYNTLVDVRNFTRQEIDLLDNIDRQRDLTIREECADSLLENLQKIAKSIDQSLDKKMSKKRALQEETDHLQEQMRTFLDKHRLYTKTVVEFQQECQRNELLRGAVEEVEGG